MVFIGAITWQLKCREQMDSLLGRRARTYMPSIISPECALFSTACGCSIMLRFNGLRGLSATSALTRTRPGLLAKNEPPACRRFHLLQRDRRGALRDFGARQAVR